MSQIAFYRAKSCLPNQNLDAIDVNQCHEEHLIKTGQVLGPLNTFWNSITNNRILNLKVAFERAKKTHQNMQKRRQKNRPACCHQLIQANSLRTRASAPKRADFAQNHAGPMLGFRSDRTGHRNYANELMSDRLSDQF